MNLLYIISRGALESGRQSCACQAQRHSVRRQPKRRPAPRALFYALTRLIADAHAVAPPAVPVGVRMRIGAAVGSAPAIRSPMKAAAAAARCERERGWSLVGRRERHRLRWRSGREADESKGRGNQDVSHRFAFRFAAGRALKGRR
jgi:hypothetical protein